MVKQQFQGESRQETGFGEWSSALTFKTESIVSEMAHPCEASARVNGAGRSESGLHGVDRAG